MNPLRGTLRCPGDRSIALRAILLTAASRGSCSLTNVPASRPLSAALKIVTSLGADLCVPTPGTVRIRGSGVLRPSSEPLWCETSATLARLLTGLLAAAPGQHDLDGNASLRGRPMARVVEPLAAAGAAIRYRAAPGRLPLGIDGAALNFLSCRLEIPSAQVKSALLLAGLMSGAGAEVDNAAGTRDHLERLLSAWGVPLDVSDSGAKVSLPPGRHQVEPRDLELPGDFSSAAPLMAAALLLPGSEVRFERVGINPTRTGFLDVVRAMGGDVRLEREEPAGPEPVADLVVRSSELTGCTVAGAVVVRAIDELPLVAVLGAFARGTTTIQDAAELRVKESDRLAALAAGLGHLGIPVALSGDVLRVHGRARQAARAASGPLPTRGDHRIAMALAVAALAAGSPPDLDRAACLADSYPEFLADLAALTSTRRC